MNDGSGAALLDIDSRQEFSGHLYHLFKRFGKEPSQPIFRSLQERILSEGPFAYFHLSNGGIRILPPIQRWSPSAFTFACWIAPTLDANEALFCFEDDSGAFVGATISSKGFIQLIASGESSDSLSTLETLHPALVPGRWQFLCIRLVRGRSTPLIGRKPQVEITVDMVPVTIPGDASFGFPKISSVIDGGIGRLGEGAQKKSSDVSEFSGQLGAIYMFNDRVTSCSVLSSIFELGFDYCLPPISDTSAISDNFLSRISHSLSGRSADVLSLSCFIFAFHPRAIEADNFCTDISPMDSETGAVTATLTENASCYIHPRLVDSVIIQSRLFLVLLDHIDSLSEDGCDVHAEIIDTIRLALSQQLFNVQIHMSDISTFLYAAGCILLQKDPRFVSLRSAEAYQQLVLHVWRKQDSIGPIVRALSNHLLRIDWWIRPEVDSETRLLFAETCRTIILGQRDVSNFDLSAFVDKFHAYTCGSDQTFLRVRHQLLTAITDLNESHYLDIINYLDDCEHPLHIAQLIELLASHLNNETDPPLIRSCLAVVLASAIRNPLSYEVLIATLHCLNVIFACSNLELSPSVFNNVFTSSFPSLLNQGKEPLLETLLYRSFLELFVCNSPPGTLGIPNIITWRLLNDPVHSHFTLPEIGDKIRFRKICHPVVLFSCLPSFPDGTFVLRDIRQLLYYSDNRDILLKETIPSWQIPLCKLIKWNSDFFMFDVNYLIFEILNIVLSHALLYRHDAVVAIRETLSCLRLSLQQWSSTVVINIERLLFSGLINEVRRTSVQQLSETPTDIFSSNMCLFGDLLEEESWCSTSSSKRKPSASESGNIPGSLDSNSSESWVLCSDDLFDDSSRPKPLPVAEVLSDLSHIYVFIDIIVRFRLPLHVTTCTTEDPHRCNLMQTFLNYLFEAISFGFAEGSSSQLDKIMQIVISLVELASSDSRSLPGNNIAIVGFLQKICTLLISVETSGPASVPNSECSKIINKLCTEIVRIFSPFIAIQAHHYDDPLVTKALTSSLLDRRFGELQTQYIHETETSALSMVLPPICGSIICVPIDIDFESHSFIIHRHTLDLLNTQSLYPGSIADPLIQSLFSAFNELSKCEQSSRSARFADCFRNRKTSVARMQKILSDFTDDTYSNDILPKQSQRMRLNADLKQRKKAAFFAQEKLCEMEFRYLLKQVTHFIHCTDLALWPEPYRVYWGLSPHFSNFPAFVLDPFLSGASHIEATHTYILQSQTSRLSLSDVRVHDSIPSFSISNDLAVTGNPNSEVDLEPWEFVDDAFISDSDGVFRQEGISIEATLVTPIARVNGWLRIDKQTIVFEQVPVDNVSNDTKRHCCPTLEFERCRVKRRNQWNMASLRSVQRRRYQLQHSALEFFFDIGTSVFFDFESSADQIRVLREITLLKPPSLDTLLMSPPRSILQKSNITRQWQRREISNFEYLSALNLISGRTSQDLNQYPIFPWVLSDYTSKSIDLNNPEVYRDLSKPIGAQTEAQTAVLGERYEHFVGSSIPPFHFGSHYSNAGIVIFYLLRLEPFSSLHIELQDGRFDFPDRLFGSVEQTYKVCTTNRSSVKELIPEFFTLPEMFLNCNKFDLGKTQSGVAVDDVQLPPWADNDPNKFVYINREALESEYVSANLPYWIDLIWGYKQRGAAAVESFNVFYHLSYEGAVDLESVSDPIQREAMRSQISQWGQIPIQLFSKPHVHREAPLCSLKHLEPNFETMPLKMMRLDETVDTHVCNLSAVNSRTIIVISDDHTTNQLSLNMSSVDGRLTLHPIAVSAGLAIRTHPNSVPLSDCVIWSVSGRYVITGNHWDCSIRLYRFSLLSSQTGSSNPFLKLATYSLLQSIRAHSGRVMCLAASKCQSIIASGSEDGNLLVWSVHLDDSVVDSVHIADIPLNILVGHDSPVICVAINLEMNICVSCSRKAMCLIHSLNDGQLIRKVAFSAAPYSIPTCALISSLGYMVFGCRATTNTPTASTSLLMYSLNGTFRNAIKVQNDPVGVVLNISHKGDVMALANLGRITIYRVVDFLVVQSCHNISSSFTSVTFSSADDLVIGGTQDGKIYIYPIENWWASSASDSP